MLIVATRNLVSECAEVPEYVEWCGGVTIIAL
jgi:hypothetical protein